MNLGTMEITTPPEDADAVGDSRSITADPAGSGAPRYFLLSLSVFPATRADSSPRAWYRSQERAGASRRAKRHADAASARSASAYLSSNQNTTATMINTRIIRSTHSGNFTPHPFLEQTPLIFSVTGAPAGPLSSVCVTHQRT